MCSISIPSKRSDALACELGAAVATPFDYETFLYRWVPVGYFLQIALLAPSARLEMGTICLLYTSDAADE